MKDRGVHPLLQSHSRVRGGLLMAGKRPRVVVVGSFMMDLVFQAPRVPEEGETVVGTSFGRFPGGKGANQAVAASRLGAEVHMVGRLGADLFGDDIMRNMEASGVDCSLVRRDPEAPSGTAGISLDGAGRNRIIIVPGANARVTTEDLDSARNLIERADAVMLQLEIPIPVDQYAASLAKKAGALVVLNPAPAQPLPDDLLALIDVVTPNEVEAESLTGIKVKDAEGDRRAAEALTPPPATFGGKSLPGG